ncbi:lytic transglycosylase domain-containing protein [Shimia sediminis]|uniref:lytic transglycosylase domain-containing protein n=1 Tax=Shimia sediminis TaxID=2497945 RepID=UPI000F8DC854|nr:lytic transglycosylase domain-containing protein [Shimia sediminis]
MIRYLIRGARSVRRKTPTRNGGYLFSAFWALLALACTSSNAEIAPENECDLAAQTASMRWGIPADVLWALTRTETGRNRAGKLQPWPWTVNVEGQGRWFATRDESQAFAYQQYKLGKRSFDLGCFQINYKWHGQKFTSLESMLDPQANADYAASFLQTLYSEFGNWSEAVAAFHSRTPEFAEKYQARYERIYASLDGKSPSSLSTPTQQHGPSRAKQNSFPLLTQRATKTSTLGSLVPVKERSAGGLWFTVGDRS